MARPTKLTPEIQAKIIKALSAGNYFDAACAYAGITPTTGYNWMARGRKAKDGIYFEFFHAIQKASADAEIENVALIKVAARESWQAAAWWLERRYPSKWGRRVTEVVDERELTEEERLAKLNELLDTARARRDRQASQE